MNTAIYIKNGHLVDPATGRDEKLANLYIEDGIITPVPDTIPDDVRIIDASGLVIAPGFIDQHVHLREPGGEASEDIVSGLEAAAAGGFVAVVSMGNTTPCIDSPERVQHALARSAEAVGARLLPGACFSRGRNGAEVANLELLAEVGTAAFTDDGSTPGNLELMRDVCRKAAELDIPVMDHAEDPTAPKGVMHAGAKAEELGFNGIPSSTEYSIVERDIELSRESGCRMVIQHVSAKESVEMIRAARAEGVEVFGEVTPHHLYFVDADIPGNDAAFKMNPPLRTAEDRAALIGGVADGTMTVLATDHAPHPADAKARGFVGGPFGIVGLETAVGATYKVLVKTGRMTLAEWIKRWTEGPAEVLGYDAPSLAVGEPADVTILDLNSEYKVEPEQFVSKSANTPFKGIQLQGRAVYTIVDGELVFQGAN